MDLRGSPHLGMHLRFCDPRRSQVAPKKLIRQAITAPVPWQPRSAAPWLVCVDPCWSARPTPASCGFLR